MKNENVVLTKDKTFWDGERALYMLLADHPHFVNRVTTIRRQLGIPRGGFADGQRAFDWEHANKGNKNHLREASDDLASDFNIKNAYRSEALSFISDYIVSPKIVENQLPLPLDLHPVQIAATIKHVGRHNIGARLIKTGNDIERSKYQFKSNALYLEITYKTSRPDVNSVLKYVTRNKKELRPFAMPKVKAAPRRAWQLFSTKKKNGMSNAQIAKAVNAQFRVRLTPQHVPSYAVRYEKVLQTLRPFIPK